MLTDAVHVEAAAIWTGGLAFLLLLILGAGGGRRWRLASVAVPAFSRVAVVSVAALVIAGAIRGLVELGSVSALWDTTYGRLLLLKIALVLPLLALGAFNNRYSVPQLRAETASPTEQRRFLRSAGAELFVVVAVVLVTAFLVDHQPPKAHQPSGNHMSVEP